METNARQKQVLIINAAPLFREFIKEKLSSENVSVEISDGQRDAFSKLIRVLPDLVIIDIEDSSAELVDFLSRKMDDPNARKIPVIISGPAMERSQISSLVQYGVVKYFSKPVKFDVFFEAIGKIIRVNLPMDTTPCVLEIHHNGPIIFVEIAQGLNREKIALLKYKISEMIDLYEIREPKMIVMMSDLQLSFVDGINLELLMDTVTSDHRIQHKNIKILSLDNFMAEFIEGHVKYVGVKVLKDLTKALGSLVGKQTAMNEKTADIIAGTILAGDARDMNSAIDIRFERRDRNEANGQHGSEGSILNIAVVDDDEVIRKILSQSFNAIGAATDVYKDGAEFIQAVREKSYDLAIVDIFMQGLSGFDVLATFRALPKPLPVIIYSQSAQREFVVKALSLGAKGYITKPQKPEAIIRKAMEVLNERA